MTLTKESMLSALCGALAAKQAALTACQGQNPVLTASITTLQSAITAVSLQSNGAAVNGSAQVGT